MKSNGITRRDVFRLASASAVLALAGRSRGAASASAAAKDARTLTRNAAFYAGPPAMAADGAGRAWLLSVIPLPGDKEQVAAYRYDGEWGQPAAITPEGNYGEVTAACAPAGRPMAAWVAERGAEWVIETAAYGNDGFGAPQVLSAPGRAANPALAAAEDGGYWLTWESYQQGRFRIMAARYADGLWTKPAPVTAAEDRCYDPTIDIDDAGRAWVAYTRAENGHRSVYLASISPDSLAVSEPVFISAGGKGPRHAPRICAHPAVACAPDGVWVAWDAPTTHKTVCWFGEREIQTRCYRDGELRHVRAQPAPFSGANDQWPAFVKDGAGRLCLLSRDWRADRKWTVRVSRLEHGGWTAPADALADQPQGRLGRPAAAPAEDGALWLAWQSDTWLDTQLEKTSSDIHAARLELAEAIEGRPRMETAGPVPRPEKPYVRVTPERPKVSADGVEYTVLFGNLHEHTNMSRCWSDGSDGNPDINYRYGLDVEKYDFVGLTDHGFDLTEAQWRESRRKTRFYNDEPHFVAVPAFEWTLSTHPDRAMTTVDPGSGHRNVVFASDADAAKWVNPDGVVHSKVTEESNRCDKVWDVMKRKGVRAVTIPHHPADKQHPMSWEFNDPERETVVEVFQARQSAEYPGCPRETPNLTPNEGCHVSGGLAKGYRFGFIASGDHNAMGTGVAALLVKEVSQEGVFEALRSRRTYGTTGEKMVVDFRVNGHIMGEAIKADGPVSITARVHGTRALKEVVIFRGREEILKLSEADLAGRTEWSSEITDTPPAGQESYYYFRVIEAPEEIAWSSPVFVMA